MQPKTRIYDSGAPEQYAAHFKSEADRRKVLKLRAEGMELNPMESQKYFHMVPIRTGMGRGVLRRNKYKPHQGKKEMARRALRNNYTV